jgi:hypothetical protein
MAQTCLFRGKRGEGPDEAELRRSARSRFGRALGLHQRLGIQQPDSDFPFFTTLGIFDVPGLRQPDGSVPGLHHFQMRFATINDLFGRYEA